jgi:hypothetical protein
MLNALSEISWLSILAAFVPYFVLGALWFTFLFPKAYGISLGRDDEAPQKPALIFIIGPALCCLVITIASAVLIHSLEIDSYENALSFSMLVGLGYLVANTFNIAINPNIPRPLLYGLISGSYHLVGISMVSMILVLMK